MPRAPTTSDAFNAIAEPRRRELIGHLAGGEPRAVGDLVLAMNLPQPAVSKHLAVLRAVGLVSATVEGRRRLYRLDASRLKAVHDWVAQYERYWSHQIDRLKERSERAAIAAARAGNPDAPSPAASPDLTKKNLSRRKDTP